MAGAAGCRPGPVLPSGPFLPVGPAAFVAVAGRTQPAGHALLRIRWRSDDGRVTLSGSGAVRMAPDSLRVDVAVRLGVGRATLILAGDSVQAEPEDMVSQLLPDRFALWAALGVVRLPGDVAEVARLQADGRTYWRVSVEGRESTFEMRGDTLVGVVRVQDGRPVAQLQLTRGPDGQVVRARVTDLARGARFEVEIISREPSEAFPPEVWRLRP